MKTAQIVVCGRVQGVGYRYFAVDRALKLGVKGTVENKNNGNVEIYCQASEDKINEFIMLLKKGPALSRVDSVVINSLEMDEFNGFRVL